MIARSCSTTDTEGTEGIGILLATPSLLHHHPTYLYTRARVKENGWMDG